MESMERWRLFISLLILSRSLSFLLTSALLALRACSCFLILFYLSLLLTQSFDGRISDSRLLAFLLRSLTPRLFRRLGCLGRCLFRCCLMDSGALRSTLIGCLLLSIETQKAEKHYIYKE